MKVKNAGCIDLGLNNPAAIALLDEAMPYEEFTLFDAIDERLKVQMNWRENPASAQGGCLSLQG